MKIPQTQAEYWELSREERKELARAGFPNWVFPTTEERERGLTLEEKRRRIEAERQRREEMRERAYRERAEAIRREQERWAAIVKRRERELQLQVV